MIRSGDHTLMWHFQPFIQSVGGSVDALDKMSASVEAELKTLLAFFGEKADSPEAPKPEDFFGLILSFSSSLQVLHSLVGGMRSC